MTVNRSTKDDLENVELEMSLVILVRKLEAKLEDVIRGILTVRRSTNDVLKNVELIIFLLVHFGLLMLYQLTNN